MTDYKDTILRAYEQACDKPDTMTWVDLILKTESKPDQKIQVMKFVLELSSPVFLAAFKENNFSNATSLEYVITGYSETVVKSAIRRLNGYALDDIENFDADAIEFYMEIYLFANEYQLTSVKRDIIERLIFWMSHLWHNERSPLAKHEEDKNYRHRPLFEQLFESIITLYDSNALYDLDTSYKDSLLISTARFCDKKKPGYVAEKCKSADEKYSEMTMHISAYREELREPCYLDKRCSYYDGCHCRKDKGEWTNSFIRWITDYDGRTWDKCLADDKTWQNEMEERDRQMKIREEKKLTPRETEQQLYMDRIREERRKLLLL
ncbi:hypothetical protein D6D06_05580 [Aureobasidium pullulans]|nr:hypothetical protein D6D06_05580 [Aureobasidium pullulans]